MTNATDLTTDAGVSEVGVQETEQSVEERLAAIAAAVAAATNGIGVAKGAGGVVAEMAAAPLTCPIDPAERALCDSCQ